MDHRDAHRGHCRFSNASELIMIQTFVFLLSLASPFFAQAAAATATPGTWSELVNLLVRLMNSGIATLILLTFVYYFYGIASNILRFYDEKPGGAHIVNLRWGYFYWGIIILFIMVSIFGILRVMENTLFGDTTTTTTTTTRTTRAASGVRGVINLSGGLAVPFRRP